MLLVGLWGNELYNHLLMVPNKFYQLALKKKIMSYMIDRNRKKKRKKIRGENARTNKNRINKGRNVKIN